ncbi:MAG: ATPase, T2SS/T4P/T4SS family [Candidatus Omnitrophota bacterium]|nr:ATPase, T2SS/T4P/T4SS family [Candidatus Omnitrophota bacterium]
MDAQWSYLTDLLIERLRGRMSLIQPAEERRQLVAGALEALYRERGQDHLPEFATETSRQEFLRAFLSYDLIEEFLADPSVEDVMINATEPIFVHKTGMGLVKTERRFASIGDVTRLVNKLIVFAGRAELDPINDVELADARGRVNIISSPFGPQITITRGKPNPLTILQLIEDGMLPYEAAAQLWLYVEGFRVRPANLLIAGGPGAGKTTLLNALLSFIPPRERLVTIEDTLELNTGCLENCSRLESCRRVKMDALVKNSLRMRPERIVVGEVRGVEAQDLMTAVNLGKYCMSTVHASSARETVLRLQHEPMHVPPILVSLLDALVVLRKLNVEGRVARVVAEVVEVAGLEQQVVLLSPIWTYEQERHRLVESSPSSVYRDRLALESGRSAVQIMEETRRRAEVLRRMHQVGRFTTIEAVTQCCQLYSDHPEQALAQLER